MIQVGLVLAGAPGHFFKTLTGLIVVGAVILNTDVARRLDALEAARAATGAAAQPPTRRSGGGAGAARRREPRRPGAAE